MEINKRMMKTDNIRKLVRTNYVTNIYKNRECQVLKKNYSWHIFLTVGQEIGNITFFFRPEEMNKITGVVI